MKPSEAAVVLATAAAFDRREVGELDAEAWHAAFAAAGLADLALEDARAAVVAHYAQTRQWLMPSDVVGYCKRVRRDRLKAAGNIYALVQADPEDGPACHAEYQRLHADIAAGRRSPAGELEGRHVRA